MTQLGDYSAAAALVLAVLALVLGVLAFRSRREDQLASARHAVIACAFFTTLAAAGIVYAFLAGDYQLEYVWSHSDRGLPLLYKVGALWGGMGGSLLFWSWLLSLYAALAMLRHRNEDPDLLGPAIAVLMGVETFFLALVVFAVSPWKRGPFIPPDGQGLNPLLQHPAMVIHPPCLYLGFVGFTVPFAFAMAALISGRTGEDWLKKSRMWAIVAWMFLAAGNVLGARWAYVELGWGGYWAWDPVENAAFMPWLAGTAFIHSSMIQERKGMLKIWNMLLITATFLLTILGTFITRSGLISSVHSFALSNIGPVFSGFLGITAVFSLGLIFWRRRQLRSAHQLESFFSRESGFLLNNLILLGGALAVLWGTLLPIVSEAAQGVRVSVGPPFFNQIMVPIGLTLLALMGVGPLLAWKRAPWASLRRVLTIPVVLGLAAAVLLLVLGVSHAYALVTFSLAAFVLAGILGEFARGVRARRALGSERVPAALYQLFRRTPRRFGGYVVHAGVVLVFVGFAGSAFNRESEQTLRRGESMVFHGYRITLQELRTVQNATLLSVGADLLLQRAGRDVARLFPRTNIYNLSRQQASEVAIHGFWGGDLYLVLAAYDRNAQTATLKAYLNPLVAWFWIGGIVIVLGGLLVLLPARARAAALLFAVLLAGGGLSARAAPPPTVEEVAGRLMDPCPDCRGKQLSSCECPGARQAREEIRSMLDRHLTPDQIVEDFRRRYGAWILSAPEKQGFDLLAYTLPFAAILAGGGALTLFLRRSVVRPDPGAKELSTDASPPLSDPDRRRLEREMDRLD